jgi:hypothetical protein
MVRERLVPVSCGGMARVFVSPEDFFNLVRHISSKYTLTSKRYAIKVMEEAKKRANSNAGGIGAGSRKGISKNVHVVGVEGNWPRRAKSCKKTSMEWFYN